MKLWFLLLGLLSLASPVLAQVLADPAQETRAVRLGGDIRCTVCQSASIEDSTAPMARDLRRLVRDKIAAGWSDRQIHVYLSARYGDFILLRPPVQANTYALWLAPAVILLAALTGMGLFLRRRTALRREKKT